MKKITILLVLLILTQRYVNGQTYTTGIVTLSSTIGLEMSTQIDITPTEATLTLIGPDDRWLSVAFDANRMFAGDVVVYDGSNLTDRTMDGLGKEPTLDTNQDWTIISDITSIGVRTIIATRDLDTGEADDYVFSTTPGSIVITWARGEIASFILDNHGGGNRGATASSITLSTNKFEIVDSFSIIPNPSSSKIQIKLTEGIVEGQISFYDYLGKKIFEQPISYLNNEINVASLSNGIYFVKVTTPETILQTKRFIKQ